MEYAVSLTDDEWADIVDALGAMGESTGDMRFWNIVDRIVKGVPYHA